MGDQTSGQNLPNCRRILQSTGEKNRIQNKKTNSTQKKTNIKIINLCYITRPQQNQHKL